MKSLDIQTNIYSSKGVNMKDKPTEQAKVKEFVKMWTNPKLINKESIDKIPSDLLERILKL